MADSVAAEISTADICRRETVDTVIIGLGMGEMTAARFQQETRDDRVLGVERQAIAGGMTRDFIRHTELGAFAFSSGLRDPGR